MQNSHKILKSVFYNTILVQIKNTKGDFFLSLTKLFPELKLCATVLKGNAHPGDKSN
jgi:hypothetical protein